MEHYDLVIVGSGDASGQALAALRDGGNAGSVLLVGPQRPDSRSRGHSTYRIGSIVIEREAGTETAGSRIDVAGNIPIVALDMQRRTLRLGDGRAVEFGRCIIADDRQYGAN